MTESGRDPVRVGVLGTGAMAQIVHLPILSEREDVEVVAVSDASVPKAEAVGERYGIPRVLTEEEIFGDPDVEALVVCTPNDEHQTQTIRALEADKDVLVERPVAFDGAGVREVLRVARESGRVLVVGMSHRYRPDASALRAFVAGGELGEVYGVRVAWLNRTAPLARVTWRQRLETAGGGVLMDLGLQALDLSLWLIGYPEVERVSATTRKGEHEVEDSASLQVATAAGAVLQVEVSSNYYAAEDWHYVRLMGREGSASMPPLSVHKRLGGRPMDVTPEQPGAQGRENLFTGAHRRQIDHFLRAVAGEAEAPLPEDQVQLMSLVRAAYRSAEEEREVSL